MTSVHPLLLILIAVHFVLALWATVGLLEWFTVPLPLPRLTNPAFSRELLLVHWLAMLGTGLCFLLGVATRWPSTPAVMVVCYAVLAAICAYETFYVLTDQGRFVSMAIEYATYAGILILLFCHDGLRTISN